jgi:Mg/Co/Ni transporter MgtE
MTVAETFAEIRRLKPEPSNIYSIFVTDKNEKLISSISLMELVVADPETKLKQLVKKNPVVVFDHDKVDTLAELFSSYNLLSIPVINKENQLEGVVVVEDIVEDLLNRRKTK